jgi:hypothetical protein
MSLVPTPGSVVHVGPRIGSQCPDECGNKGIVVRMLDQDFPLIEVKFGEGKHSGCSGLFAPDELEVLDAHGS